MKQIITKDEIEQIKALQEEEVKIDKQLNTLDHSSPEFRKQCELKTSIGSKIYGIAGNKLIKLNKKSSRVTAVRVEATSFGGYPGVSYVSIDSVKNLTHYATRAIKLYVKGKITLEGNIEGKRTLNYMLKCDAEDNVYVKVSDVLRYIDN